MTDLLWYKDALIYEVHVRAFSDSNGDGVGDFAGLTQKLPYLADLGVTCLWLLPFYPSPLRDDGYDIADYTSINPIYGSLDDFKRFVDEAHRRHIRVLTELVVNHTSDQHPDRKSTRLNSSHLGISYAVFCLEKKNNTTIEPLVLRSVAVPRSAER